MVAFCSWHYLFCLILGIIPSKGSTYSPYPCVWIDNETNAQLDLQIFKNSVLYKYDSSYLFLYIICNNQLKGSNGSSMAIITPSGEGNQTLAVWNNGTVYPQYTPPDYSNAQWSFYYFDPTIPCIFNETDTVSFNLTWLQYDNVYSPSYLHLSKSGDDCHVQVSVQLSFLTDCTILESGSSINLSIFTYHTFESEIENVNQKEILYTPCSDLFICHNLYTQAIIKDVGSSIKECDAYLAMFVNFRYVNYNFQEYMAMDYDTTKQLTTIVYKTGENCTISNGNNTEIIPRNFYVYWQCNTLAKPYKIVSSFEIDRCTNALTIDSIRACPNFQECVYYDGNNKLNITELIGINIATAFVNEPARWLFYSVCQFALQSIQTKDISTLYQFYGFDLTSYTMAAEYVQIDTEYFNKTKYLPASDEILTYYYDSEDNEWIFEFLSNINLFSVTWQCGGDSLYDIIEAYTSDKADSVVISTYLC